MFGKYLAVGLLAGVSLLVGAATVRADDTIVLKRVKNEGVVQNLVNDGRVVATEDVRYHGGRGFYYGGYYGRSYYPYRSYYAYYPRISVGVYTYPTYVAPTVYYYPSTTYLYAPISDVPTVSTPVPRLQGNTSVRPAANIVNQGPEPLPPPHLEKAIDQTIPNDVRPQEALPLPRREKAIDPTIPNDVRPPETLPVPRPDPAGKIRRLPADAKDEGGKVVSLPAQPLLSNPVYGEKPARTQFAEDRRLVVKS